MKVAKRIIGWCALAMAVALLVSCPANSLLTSVQQKVNDYQGGGTVDTPVITPGTGTYSSDQSVTIGCATPGAVIHCTTDGSTPTASTPAYDGKPILVAGDGTIETIKAVAVKSKMKDSQVAIGTFTISYQHADKPALSPGGGVIASATTVTIRSTSAGALICYTTDGTWPTESGGVITNGTSLSNGGSITVSADETVKAIAYGSGWVGSPPAVASYCFPPAMVSIPGGTFQRDSGSSDLTTISSFHMSQNPITRAKFLAVMGADPSDASYSTGMSDPVQWANWYMAIAFCNKLSIAQGLTPVYGVSGVDFSTLAFSSIPTWLDATWEAATANWSANGYRLPTEMEWMWSAMGATSDACPGDMVGGVNTGGYLKGYAGSVETGSGQTNVGSYAWYNLNSAGKTHPVGTKTANELGIYDLSGNVWEWCWDWSASWPTGSNTNPTGPSTGSSRVIHGGGWGFPASTLLLSYETSSNANYQTSYDGFRVVKAP